MHFMSWNVPFLSQGGHCCCLAHTFDLVLPAPFCTLQSISESQQAFSYLHTDNGKFHDCLINRNGLHLFLFSRSIYVLYMHFFKLVEEKFRQKHLLKINFNFVLDLYIFFLSSFIGKSQINRTLQNKRI